MSQAVPTTAAAPGQMTHRQILEALSGLLLAMFVAMLSSTVVSNALPTIVADLHGSQTGYTWVVVATLLTMTATTPIWGKLSDLYSKKLLVQVALVVFLIGSILAGSSDSMGTLIAARAVQGLGVGGLTALVQVVIATMVSPRERGRYAGYLGAVFASATVAGPLIGGLLVDTVGWRWCFFVSVPVALVALVLLHKTLHLPVVRRSVSIDWLGATLIMGGVSVLLVWVSLAGNDFDWASTTTTLMVTAGVALIAAAIWVEARWAADPVIPLRLFRDRTTALATIASTFVGVTMFVSTVYLSQYFQLARGMSPTEAGLMSIFQVSGLLLTSIVTGRLISTSGYWKRYLVAGMATTAVGTTALSTITSTTNLWLVGVYMLILGMGLGATMQNLILSVQNNTALSDMGAVSSVVAFFRSVGGSVGVSALGALLSHQVFSNTVSGLQSAGIDPSGLESHSVPDLDALPQAVRVIIEHSYGVATGHVFAVVIPFAVAALISVLFIREVRLRETVLRDDELSPEVAAELGINQPLGLDLDEELPAGVIASADDSRAGTPAADERRGHQS